MREKLSNMTTVKQPTWACQARLRDRGQKTAKSFAERKRELADSEHK